MQTRLSIHPGLIPTLPAEAKSRFSGVSNPERDPIRVLHLGAFCSLWLCVVVVEVEVILQVLSSTAAVIYSLIKYSTERQRQSRLELDRIVRSFRGSYILSSWGKSPKRQSLQRSHHQEAARQLRLRLRQTPTLPFPLKLSTTVAVRLPHLQVLNNTARWKNKKTPEEKRIA